MSQMPERDRSKQAFEDLYDRVAKRLLIYITRRMRDTDAAAELWSECWAAAFERWPRCRAEGPGEVEAWMFAIARNRLADYYRSGAIKRRGLTRLRWAVPALAAAEDDELERIVELDALKTVVSDALNGLSARRRRAVQLRIVGGLSYSEVAARMGCSEQTARAHVSRGLRRLAKAIDQNQRLELEGRMR